MDGLSAALLANEIEQRGSSGASPRLRAAGSLEVELKYQVHWPIDLNALMPLHS